MVAGKVKHAIGFNKPPSSLPRPKFSTAADPFPLPPPPPPASASRGDARGSSDQNCHRKTTVFGRSFGGYFPRNSAQVQPRPPDVSELIRLVEELRVREHRLQTELLEQKLLKEAVAIVPTLENEIASKTNDLEIFAKRIEALESENQRLIHEGEMLMAKMEEERRERDMKAAELETEVALLKRKLADKVRVDNDEISASQRFQGLIEISSKSNLIKSLNAKKVTRSNDSSSTSFNGESLKAPETKTEELESDMRRHSPSSSEELPEISVSADVRSRVPRVPKPPPSRISSSFSPATSSASSESSLDNHKSSENSSILFPPPPPPPPTKSAPPPPPPPLPAKSSKAFPAKVRRVPEVVEFYHSLMRRDSRRDSGAGTTEVSTASARDLVGEFENRSSYLLSIKTDVETQGDFIRFLIKEIEDAAFSAIEDVVSFVKWLDDELSYLVDERGVLKHFNWPEKKADALREAAFEYCDLKKLESEASGFIDNPRQPISLALKKMQTLLEKLEHGVYNLSRLRESATNRFKSFHIPVDWMIESGQISQIKLASVKLAMNYMKRVSAELETAGGGPDEQELIVQGVRFAFRVHQFAGGFDVETMRAFQELRDKAGTCHGQQPKLACRSTLC
ncbi:hypothetical protein V2J09_016988 [Rumex salicifolius]